MIGATLRPIPVPPCQIDAITMPATSLFPRILVESFSIYLHDGSKRLSFGSLIPTSTRRAWWLTLSNSHGWSIEHQHALYDLQSTEGGTKVGVAIVRAGIPLHAAGRVTETIAAGGRRSGTGCEKFHDGTAYTRNEDGRLAHPPAEARLEACLVRGTRGCLLANLLVHDVRGVGERGEEGAPGRVDKALDYLLPLGMAARVGVHVSSTVHVGGDIVRPFHGVDGGAVAAVLIACTVVDVVVGTD